MAKMKYEYDLSAGKSRKNPYASQLKNPNTTHLSQDQIQPQAEFENIRLGVIAGLDQIERGELAPGSGEQAIKRAFRRASGNLDD